MAVDEYTYKVLEEQRALVLALNDIPIVETAKDIAFYSAMLDAALDDPFDDEEEQEEILAYFKKNLQELIETYQQLVNDKL